MKPGPFGCGLAILLAAPPAAAQDAAPPPPRVEEVRVVGGRAVDAERVRAVVRTRESRCRSILYAPACALGDWRWAEQVARLDTAELRRDVARIEELYDAWGYPRARVEADVLPSGEHEVRVRFRVAEGAPLRVRSLRVTGLEALPRPVEVPDLPLDEGDPYALPLLEASQRLLARRLAEMGHPFAQVEAGGAVLPEEHAADVVLEVRAGPRAVFGPTEVAAEAPLSRDAVRRRLAYRAGTRFDPDALERTAERLYALPIVERVEIEPVPVAWSDSVVETRIRVSTGRATAYQVEGTFSSSSCLSGVVWWGSRHFLGAPRVLTVSVGASNLLADALEGFPCTGAGGGDFSDPDYFVRGVLRQPVGPTTWLLLEGAYVRESAARAFIRRGLRARLGMSRSFPDGWEAALAYAPERSDFPAAAPLFCALEGVCGGPGLEALTGTSTLAPVEASVARAPREAGVLLAGPREGPRWLLAEPPEWVLAGRILLSGAAGATGSEVEFGRAELQGSAARLVGTRAAVVARGRVGALQGGDLLPPHLRLFGGGPAGVRGVAANLLGPKLLLARPGAVPECAAEPRGCAGAEVPPDSVRVRPLGGDLLVELGVEAEVWATEWAKVALFVDWGAVRATAPLRAGGGWESVAAPGVGVLLLRPFGPLRVDVAYDPSPARRYPLLVPRGEGEGFRPAGEVLFRPFEHGEPGPLEELWRRLQLQLSMGAPF